MNAWSATPGPRDRLFAAGPAEKGSRSATDWRRGRDPWRAAVAKRCTAVAERVGFEPTVPLRAPRISSAVLSTAQPPLRPDCVLPRRATRAGSEPSEGVEPAQAADFAPATTDFGGNMAVRPCFSVRPLDPGVRRPDCGESQGRPREANAEKHVCVARVTLASVRSLAIGAFAGPDRQKTTEGSWR